MEKLKKNDEFKKNTVLIDLENGFKPFKNFIEYK